MKGTLHKTEQGWMVSYLSEYKQSHSSVNEWRYIPLHPYFIEMMETCFTSKFTQEVEFEIVTEWENGEVGVNGLTYAKLIKEEKPFIDNRKEKLETLARLLAKSWYYGDWDWETPNERIMQMIMQDLGLYPFKSEDEMIQQTRVDEDLYKEAVDKVKLRKPRLMPIETHPVDTNEMIKDDVEKLAEEFYPLNDDLYPNSSLIRKAFTTGYTKAKETLYTEEQVEKLMYWTAKMTLGVWHSFKSEAKIMDELDSKIQSLKQPKK